MDRSAAPSRKYGARWWATGAVAGAVLALAGCGGAAAPQVPTAVQGSAAPTASAPAGGGIQAQVASYLDQRRKWAKCMRDQGLDVPDPDAKGFIDDDLSKTDPKVQKAAKACYPLWTTEPREVDEYLHPLTPEQLAANRTYAECVRKNGEPDYPDPQPNGYIALPAPPSGGGMPPRQPASALKALETCRKAPDYQQAFPEPSGEGVG